MSPLLTVWFKPGTTIERVLAAPTRLAVWPLAILVGIYSVVSQLISAAPRADLFDWRLLVGAIVLGALLGIVLLFVQAWLLRLAGKMLGGPAPVADLRALLAWGAVPQIAGLAVCFALLAGLRSSTGGKEPFIVLMGFVALAVTLWSWLLMLFMLARVQHFGFLRTFASGIFMGVAMVVLVISFRTFLFQPFNIPAGSMKPTLLVGDYLFTSKYAYGYSRFSIPFSPPLFSGRILASEPQRGDVVVFKLPRETSVDYIKRVVGLPGDRIQMINGVLNINGQPVKRERMDDFVDTEDGRTTQIKQWRETLPNGVSYATLDLFDNGRYDNTQVYTVPAGHYFMMGDHRDNSTDSRILSEVGYVPLENLVGRAGMIFYSVTSPQSAAQSGAIRQDRFGKLIR